MTRDSLAGKQTSYYPEGRSLQRPATLMPSDGETPRRVLTDWESAAIALDDAWSELDDEQWNSDVVEPADNADLGTVPLARLALARLTEVEVHGTDLGIGLPDWSSTFVEVGLSARLSWLSNRRRNHWDFDDSIRGSWLLSTTEGLRWLVAVDGDLVRSRAAIEGDATRAAIAGSNRDVLALLLGRPRAQPLKLSGDLRFAASFELAFPGP
jgi:hypothetical protein